MTSPTDALSKIWLDLGLPADALEAVMGHEGAWSASGEQILDTFQTQSS